MKIKKTVVLAMFKNILGTSGLFWGPLTLLPAVLPAVAHAESRVGNGGDALAAEFAANADEVLQLATTLAQTNNVTMPAGFNLDTFTQKIRTAKVYTQDHTFSNGFEVDALNFPDDNRIVVNRTRWKSIYFDLKVLRQLVIHEYLGLARAEDTSYQISSFVIRKINNGGDKGELWLLKDIDDKRYNNPFYGAYLDAQLNLFAPSRTPYTIFLQEGRKLAEQDVNKTKAYCAIAVPALNISSTPANSVKVKLQVFSADETTGIDGQPVAIEVQKAALITKFVCTNGAGNTNKTTVKDALDSLGNYFYLNHLGSSRLGNQCQVSE